MASFGQRDPDWQADSRSRLIIFPILALVCIVGLMAATGYLYWEVTTLRTEMNGRFQTYGEQMAKMEATFKNASKTIDAKVKEAHGVIEKAQTKLSQTAPQGDKQTLLKAEQVAKSIAQDVASKLEVKQNAVISKVGMDVQDLRRASSETEGKLGSLSGEVTDVKKVVGQTRTELETTVAALRTVRGDLGVQSGLIATSSKELQALRELGQRNYYDFTLTKTAQPQQVGDVRIRLKKTDVKRDKFTVEVWADDKKIEKKDKTLNEAVQFYVGQLRTPYELVVNRIQKDQLTGYLSTPKVPGRR
jgi:hypothetical protein